MRVFRGLPFFCAALCLRRRESISFSDVATCSIESLEPRQLLTGDLDPTFGTNGVVLPTLTANTGFAGAIVVRPDRHILQVVGNDSGQSKLRQLNPNGSIDKTFGQKGSVSLDGPLSS